MKKFFLILLILFNIINCTAFKNNIISVEQTDTIVYELNDNMDKFLNAVSMNKYEEIENFFLKTLRNSIILKNLNKYDLSGVNVLFSQPTIIDSKKAKNILVATIGTNTVYYEITWIKAKENENVINNNSIKWKISHVKEKK